MYDLGSNVCTCVYVHDTCAWIDSVFCTCIHLYMSIFYTCRLGLTADVVARLVGALEMCYWTSLEEHSAFYRCSSSHTTMASTLFRRVCVVECVHVRVHVGWKIYSSPCVSCVPNMVVAWTFTPHTCAKGKVIGLCCLSVGKKYSNLLSAENLTSSMTFNCVRKFAISRILMYV